MEKLTILECLCILKAGWSTPEERKLGEIAWETIKDEAHRLTLIYKKDLIEKELKNLTPIQRPKIGGLSSFGE